MVNIEQVERVIRLMRDGQAVEALGGIRIEVLPSDKVGYDMECYYVNDVLVKKIYIPQSVPVGTADNPIVWKPGMQLIQNAYYTCNGTRKVWTGCTGSETDWGDNDFVIF